MKHLTNKELRDKLLQFPDDAKVCFYDIQWEHATWGVTSVELDKDGDIIMKDEDYGL